MSALKIDTTHLKLKQVVFIALDETFFSIIITSFVDMKTF